MIHEITHVLGFSTDFFSNFIDPSTGKAYSKSGNSPVTTETIRGVSTHVISTKNVV